MRPTVVYRLVDNNNNNKNKNVYKNNLKVQNRNIHK